MAFFSFLSWFRPWWKAAETDYETVLARLTKDIAGVQARLVRVNQRERRASVTLTMYAVLLCLAYAGFIHFSTADMRPLMSKGERLRLWLPVVVGLVVIISVRSVVRWWFKRVSDGEEKHLRSLQRARRKKIDEIKQATRYDHLRSLLEKYDDTGAIRPGAVRRGASTTSVASKGGAAPATVTNGKGSGPRQFQGKRDGLPTNSGAGSTLVAQEESVKLPARKPVEGDMPGPVPTIIKTNQNGERLPFEIPQQQLRFQKTWLDRLADKILGAETKSQEGGEEQRYALICHVCYSHNGLCPQEDWEEVQYICPRCGTFNSRRPSSVPVTSPWSSRNSGPRASLGGVAMSPSPSRSLSELPSPSPSTRSMLLLNDSVDDSLAERRPGRMDVEAQEDVDEDGVAGWPSDADNRDGESGSKDGVEAVRRRGGVKSSALKGRDDEDAMLRKRAVNLPQTMLGDESAEPMLVD